MNPNVIVLSHPTYVGVSGATAAATYSFFTKDYKPPSQDRAIDHDDVLNQNGRFRYIYDNGPGFKQWPPFSILCEKPFDVFLGGGADTQFNRLKELWEHKGTLGMQTPDGVYTVAWAASLDRNFRIYPPEAGATNIDQEVVVQFEEAQ